MRAFDTAVCKAVRLGEWAPPYRHTYGQALAIGGPQLVKAKVENETMPEQLARQFAAIDQWARENGLPRNPSIALTKAELDEVMAHAYMRGWADGLVRYRKWLMRQGKRVTDTDINEAKRIARLSVDDKRWLKAFDDYVETLTK